MSCAAPPVVDTLRTLECAGCHVWRLQLHLTFSVRYQLINDFGVPIPTKTSHHLTMDQPAFRWYRCCDGAPFPSPQGNPAEHCKEIAAGRLDRLDHLRGQHAAFPDSDDMGRRHV